MCHKLENIQFSCTFLNMDISLIISLSWLKTYIHIAEMCMEGSVSQNFDIGLSFYFM